MKKTEIIIPVGVELRVYLSNGYYICNECGALMDLEEDPSKDPYSILNRVICPACNWATALEEYEYEGEYEEEDWDEDTPPMGCSACGGPYPHCQLSCKLFDD